MRTLVIYDISDDRKRKRVAEACLDYGLERIQWSAFEGELTSEERRELAARCRAILGKGKDKGEVQFIPVCEKDLVRRDAVTTRNDKRGKVSTDCGHRRQLCRSVRPWAATRTTRPLFTVFPLPLPLEKKTNTRKTGRKERPFRFFWL
ncbi:MAG: CRISPR-associated endonuclease Cas2 [Limnochordales bacterium]|nr:CRISPR-associated endonuclease Cas2 [Limnochordales bacterium]